MPASADLPDFPTFEADALRRGFDAALERVWAPGQIVETHNHPFVADALVVAGEMWLERADGRVDRLVRGDRFALAANEPHAERYGPEGATYWVARRHAPGGATGATER